MKISVIIPVYNVEKYLKKCVDSVLAQDFSDYEILLIDDGSTDSSGEICDEYAEKNANVTVVHQENKGLGGARNTGISKAQGEYLLFVDSDDWIKGNMLSSLYTAAENANNDVVCFSMEFVDEQGNTTDIKRPYGKKPITLSDFPAVFSLDPYVCNKLFRRSLFNDNSVSFPLRVWYEDLCTTPKILLCAKKIAFTDDVFYYYLQRENSIMHVKNTDRNEDMLYVIKSVLSFYREQNRFDAYRDALCFMTVMHMMVLCTLRVAADDPRHPLLKRFYDFTKENFADFATNKFVRNNLSKRHRVIFWFSKHRFYLALKLLDRLNRLRK